MCNEDNTCRDKAVYQATYLPWEIENISRDVRVKIEDQGSKGRHLRSTNRV